MREQILELKELVKQEQLANKDPEALRMLARMLGSLTDCQGYLARIPEQEPLGFTSLSEVIEENINDDD
tara:strand:- start:463 stop:669 length:207 start_codon:yes stop_codon:yes gene_type:complete